MTSDKKIPESREGSNINKWGIYVKTDFYDDVINEVQFYISPQQRRKMGEKRQLFVSQNSGDMVIILKYLN